MSEQSHSIYVIIYQLKTPVLAPPLSSELTPLLLCNHSIVTCVLRVKPLRCLVAYSDVVVVIFQFFHSKSKRSNSTENSSLGVLKLGTWRVFRGARRLWNVAVVLFCPSHEQK